MGVDFSFEEVVEEEVGEFFEMVFFAYGQYKFFNRLVRLLVKMVAEFCDSKRDY